MRRGTTSGGCSETRKQSPGNQSRELRNRTQPDQQHPAPRNNGQWVAFSRPSGEAGGERTAVGVAIYSRSFVNAGPGELSMPWPAVSPEADEVGSLPACRS